MEYLNIDGQHFYNMMINACNKLEQQKEFINSLNVFPVPDGDTGTNMSMTFKAAVTEMTNSKIDSIGEASKRLSKGALMGARGNSGVILSQILRGISKGLEGKDSVNASEFSNSIFEGSKSAYKAVMRPTEGTILTVIRAAGESAVKCQSNDIVELMKEVCDYSEYILNKTPEMLPVLKKAKVVDAGGTGLFVILKGMYEVLKENLQPKLMEDVKTANNVSPVSMIQEQEIKFGYCTEFLILTKGTKNVDKFKSELELHGDSMIVVAVDDIIKVHIHTNDPGLVLSKAVKLGELSKVKIDNMREEHRHLLVTKEDKSNESLCEEAIDKIKEYAFISVAMGSGIKDIFNDLGVDVIIEGGQTMNPSTQDIVNSINKISAKNIFVLPNNKNIIMAASQAAELTNKNVVVIPTKTIPQGITCITMFNSEVSVEDNIEEMTKAIDLVSTGSVTYAVRDTEVDGKQISEGDILGLIEGKIKQTGNDIYKICEKTISDLVNESSELITILYGKECDEKQVNELISLLEEKYSDIDVQCYDGQQPLYYFIISVE